MKKLNFGCGKDIKKGFDNLDLKDFDFNNFPYPINNNTYDYILASSILEHLKEPEKVIDELWRITKNKGIVEIIVPHFNNEGAFSDLGHLNYFTIWSFRGLIDLNKTWIVDKIKWEILELLEVPSKFGKWIFIPYIRRKLSLLVRGLYFEIRVKLRVIK